MSEESTTSDGVCRRSLGYDEVRQLLPHEPPFVFVDRVVECEPGQRITCLKNISSADVLGHFPGLAVMPGVLMLETIAQSALLLVRLSQPETKGRFGVLRAIQSRFHRLVVPGDQLMVEVTMDKSIASGCVISARGSVEHEKVVSAQMTFGIADRRKLFGQRGDS